MADDAFDATDPSAENNARRDAERIARQDTDVMSKLIMAEPAGRAWLYRLLSRCHIYGDTFAGEQTHLSAFNQGQENIGKQIMVLAQNASVDLYLLMIKEAQSEDKRVADVRSREETKRQQSDEATTDSPFMPDLPPPAGYPGGPPLPTKKKPDKSK